MIAIRRRIADFAVNFITSTNKSLGLAAGFGIAWAADNLVGNNVITLHPTPAVIALLVAVAADLCALAWWRYYAPTFPAYSTPEEAIEHLVAVGVDPVELEAAFGVTLIDYAAQAAGLPSEDEPEPAR